MRDRHIKTIFLTGGTGVLGQSLVNALRGDYRLVCLSRRSGVAPPGVEILHGDITQCRFGLDDAAFAFLAGRIDWIIHCAAITRLDGDGDEIHQANVVGTGNVLALARKSGKPLYHVSTAFTHDCDFFDGVAAPTAYECAKRLAEQRVRESELPVTIFKPSIIIGDAATGAMPSFQGFHLTVGLIFSGVLPIVPCPSQARVDVVARDVAAAAIKSALDRELIGGDYYLTSGDRAPTIERLIDIIAAVAGQSAMPFSRPRCMHPDVFDRLIKPVFLPTIKGPLQAALLRAAAMCRYVCLRSPLPGDLPTLIPEAIGTPRDAAVELQRSIEFMQPRLAAFSRMAKLARRAPRLAADARPNPHPNPHPHPHPNLHQDDTAEFA
jgi:nucleoside-diphosphate-sugar epimerase